MHNKSAMKSGALEWQLVPAPLVAPAVLLFCITFTFRFLSITLTSHIKMFDDKVSKYSQTYIKPSHLRQRKNVLLRQVTPYRRNISSMKI